MPTVLIIDDHASFRRAACAVLTMGGFTVTGEADSGSAGLAAAGELRPDVVLVDVQMPGMDGFEVAASLKARDRRTGVVLTSSRSRTEYGARIDRSAADGFVEKRDLTAQRVAEIAAVVV